MHEFQVTDVDNFPPASLLDQFPNWVCDNSGESKFIADGCHIKPQRQDSRIQIDTEYSAGYVILPNETQHTALIGVTAFGAIAIIVYADQVWALARKFNNAAPYDSLQFRITRYWGICDTESRPQGFDDQNAFPLRYSTELSHASTRRPIVGMILADGQQTAWEV